MAECGGMNAKELVLRLQAQGDHSEAELRSQLERRGFARIEIEEALGWGREHAAVDDARAADGLIERQRNKGRGPLRIEAELERRGLDADAAEASQQVRARAVAALQRHAERFAGEPLKAAGWLARQGYEEDTVRAVVEELIGPLD